MMTSTILSTSNVLMHHHHKCLKESVNGLLNMKTRKLEVIIEITIPETALPYNNAAASRCMYLFNSNSLLVKKDLCYC